MWVRAHKFSKKDVQDSPESRNMSTLVEKIETYLKRFNKFETCQNLGEKLQK